MTMWHFSDVDAPDVRLHLCESHKVFVSSLGCTADHGDGLTCDHTALSPCNCSPRFDVCDPCRVESPEERRAQGVAARS